MFSMETFSRFAAAAALALALAALLRPEIERWARQRRRLRVLPASKVDIGFSDWGPTIGLAASFHGQGTDVFVVDMSLRVERGDEGSGHRFSWAAFLPARLNAGPDEATAPGAFSVSRIEPRRVSILFQDIATQRLYADGLRSMRRRFAEFMAFQRLRPEIMSQNDLGREIANFRASARYDGAVAGQADSAFYWEAGEYSVALAVQTADELYTERYRFSLSAEDAAELRGNIVRIEDVNLGLSSRGPATISVLLDKIA